MKPWLNDGDIVLYHGDCLEVLRSLPSGSVHMCATSPPFWNLRDYNAPGQIGLEPTPEAWTANLVTVFREVHRVLRDDGTLWIECGDMYAANRTYQVADNKHRDVGNDRPMRVTDGYKQKDLIGAPWLLAFALRADGWYLRSEIIWAKPNPMPESVSDRPTKAHSTVFLLSKKPRYFFDQDSIREPYKYDGRKVLEIHGTSEAGHENYANREGKTRWPGGVDGGANARTVWSIPTEPTPFAHFATWPQKLVRRMILAGTSERGCCPECGAPWVRETAEAHDAEGRTTNGQKPRTSERRGFDVRMVKSTSTLGWHPTCNCRHATSLPVPCTVLDPFAGSATTMLVARANGRHAIGIELNEEYLKIAHRRLGSNLNLFAPEAT